MLLNRWNKDNFLSFIDSHIINYPTPINLSYMWSFSIIIFFLMMATAFLSYVLPWGQMSFWSATVIINLFFAIPFYPYFYVKDFFLCCFYPNVLGWIGQNPVESPYIEIGMGATLFYFVFFLVLIPLIRIVEKQLVCSLYIYIYLLKS